MSKPTKRPKGNGEREIITVSLPPGIAERLSAFCREMNVTPDQVIERALADYFREGDVSH